MIHEVGYLRNMSINAMPMKKITHSKSVIQIMSLTLFCFPNIHISQSSVQSFDRIVTFENTPVMLLQGVYRDAVHDVQVGLEAALSLGPIIAALDGASEGLGLATLEPRVVIEAGFVFVYPSAVRASVKS